MYLHFELDSDVILKLSVTSKTVKLLVVVRHKSLKGPDLEMACHPNQVREVRVERMRTMFPAGDVMVPS